MVKAIVGSLVEVGQDSTSFYAHFDLVYMDSSSGFLRKTGNQISVDYASCSEEAIKNAVKDLVIADASSWGYTVTADNIVHMELNSTAGLARSFANPSRSLNSAFQVSTTRDAQVSYSVDVACSASLLGGQTGTVFLEYADDSGFTTNVKEIGRQVNGNSVSLAIAITLNQNITATVSGIIPAGKYVRLRTQNNTGTPTFTFRSAQEVLL